MTSTEPTINRLARAADCVAQTHGQEGHLRAQSLGDDMAKAIVRTILRELREPGDAAAKAGGNRGEWNERGNQTDERDRRDAVNVWQAMIDSILEGK